MADKEINIKSSTIEKGIELAKEFLDKLISPTVEEIGLLLSDNIKFLRFKNQVQTLLKARKYVESKGLSIKEIPIKILVPLLENASLEENENMQEKWAKMLANMVDSETNLQNQIFPYLLSQISFEEYEGLRRILAEEKKYTILRKELSDLQKKEKPYSPSTEFKHLREKVNKMDQEGFLVDLQGFEYTNLERLGLLRGLPPRILIEEFKTGGYDKSEEWHQIEAEYDISDYGYRLTELGEKFIEVCEFEISPA